MDFTLKKYRQFLEALIGSGYKLLSYGDYFIESLPERFVILRHDVDELANHALSMAQLESKLGVKTTYYFRIVKQSNNPEIIRKIAAMGHEIGYHYEDLSMADGDYVTAIKTFERNLQYFRSFYPIKTICMHGSSTSKYDNRLLWKKYSLDDYGVIGEPYLTTDFDKVFYLTDTGYSWDGGKYSVRDVVENEFGLTFHSTDEIIDCVKSGNFPAQAMILAHTLWTDNIIKWYLLHIREFCRNRVKLIAQRNKFISKIYKNIVKLYWNYPKSKIK